MKEAHALEAASKKARASAVDALKESLGVKVSHDVLLRIVEEKGIRDASQIYTPESMAKSFKKMDADHRPRLHELFDFLGQRKAINDLKVELVAGKAKAKALDAGLSEEAAEAKALDARMNAKRSECVDLPSDLDKKSPWSDGANSCSAYDKAWCDAYGETNFNGSGTATDHCCACGGGKTGMKEGPLEAESSPRLSQHQVPAAFLAFELRADAQRRCPLVCTRSACDFL